MLFATCSFLLLLASPGLAEAFCGFYVSNESTDLYNEATMVSLLRDGQTTVMAMRNDYQGPPEDFAMVVPVPVVLKKKQVKTLDEGVFGRLRTQTAPRLVEYWQQDPCERDNFGRVQELGGVRTGGGATTTGEKGGGGGHVTIEAEFKVG